MGALGAHALHATLAANDMLEAWRTAVLYHLVHTLALLGVSLWACTRSTVSSRMQLAVWAWAVGIVFFSGSLYGLALGGPGLLGPITPLGGLAFMIGWGALIAEGFRTRG